MMRPAASERRGPHGSAEGGGSGGKGKRRWLPPVHRFPSSTVFIYFTVFFFLLLLLEKMESCPEYILSLALVICHLLKNL